MKIINAISDTLQIDRFEIKAGEAWCVYGGNNNGIHTFVRWISRKKMPGSFTEFVMPEKTGRVTFEEQQQIFEDELKKDQTDILDRIDPGTPARRFLGQAKPDAKMIEAFGMTPHLDKGYRQLSTGQSRKLMLLAQLTTDCDFVFIENPFEGLDEAGRKELSRAMACLADMQIRLLFVVHNKADIPRWCNHMAVIRNGRMAFVGNRSQALEYIQKNKIGPGAPPFVRPDQVIESRPLSDPRQVLVDLKNGLAAYGGANVFTNFDLYMEKGCHTLITGPNGSGKSTLIQVITGDHPACYTNDLTLFGIRRGSGESIWDLKKQMGIVSSELHRNYIVPGNVLHCVLSGLFDSIGLYRKATPGQEKKAFNLLESMGLENKAHLPFRQLHFSLQRLVLIARALIKMPKLLILDEPTQGLDQYYRGAVLDFLSETAKKEICTILYVSHRPDEFRPFFRQRIQMG